MEEQKGGMALAHPAVNLYLCRRGIQTLRPHHHPCAPPHSLQKMISYSYYIYNKIWRPIVRLLRFRHRCGYGIHSPFAWAKVTGVIYERGLYYAYAPLLTAHPMGGGRHDGMTLGDLRLLFRLSNDTHPRRGHIVIQKGLAAPAAYLRSGCKSCQWTTADSANPTLPAAETLDFVYLDAPEAWPALAQQAVEQLSDGGALVIRGIHRKAADRAAWRRLQAQQQVRVTFDLYEFGLVYVEQRLNKEDYLISY